MSDWINTKNDCSNDTIYHGGSQPNTIKARQVSFITESSSSVQISGSSTGPSVRVSVTLSNSKKPKEVPINIKAEKNRAIYEQINKKIGR